jgi:hypothetical protein
MDESQDITARKIRLGDWEIDIVRPEPSRCMSNASGSGVHRLTLIKKVASIHTEAVTAATNILAKALSG